MYEEERLVTIRTHLLSAGLAIGLAVTAGFAVHVSAQAPAAPAAVPAAPSGLTYYVNGSSVSLLWTAPAANFTQYVLEAGAAPGQTFFQFATSTLANPGLLTERISTFSTAGVGNGVYYVRVRGANGEGVGPASAEVAVPITGACQAAAAPTDLTAIVRGSTAWIQWQLGSGGLQSSFILVARATPTGAPVAVFPTTQFFLNVGGIPPGTYYVSVVSVGRCGPMSAESSQVVVTAPGNSPATTPNPVGGGRLALPYIYDQVVAFTNANPGLLQASCPNPSSKYTRNPYIDGLVDYLRTIDRRFGYNSKPTRGPADNGGQPVVIAGDEVAYHYGADAPEGSANTYLIDVISGHCGTPSLTYRNFTFGEYGRWTGAGRF